MIGQLKWNLDMSDVHRDYDLRAIPRPSSRTILMMAFVTTGAFTISHGLRPALSQRKRAFRASAPRMGLRAVESYDSSFTLAEEVQSALNSMLLGA